MRALSVVLLLLVAAPAFADAPPPAEDPPPPTSPITPPALTKPIADPEAEAAEPLPKRHDYRWQLIVSDGAAIATSLLIDRIAADGGSRPAVLATPTIASYFFTAPMIHGVHRQGRRALTSF